MLSKHSYPRTYKHTIDTGDQQFRQLGREQSCIFPRKDQLAPQFIERHGLIFIIHLLILKEARYLERLDPLKQSCNLHRFTLLNVVYHTIILRSRKLCERIAAVNSTFHGVTASRVSLTKTEASKCTYRCT